ncbi:Conserved_hypothetical protein [Hexamita inflata]|uniref:Uncharacterized protein n=1 Tax=Hexamita inflata TaxID=28002 RepID=A0AA86N8C9_9EUKA|nr:Conserved hypothetical protein [Hexamita inflata]
MNQNECPKWMIIPHCKYVKSWHPAIIIIGELYMLIQSIFSIVILVKLIKTKKANYKAAHIFITICLLSCALLRLPWWYMNSVVYYDNTPPAVAVQVLNRLAMLFLYLAQSYYVQTWLVLIFTLNAQVGKKQIQITFISFDIIVSGTILFTVISRFWDKEVHDNGSYGILYEISTKLLGVASLFTSIMFISIGSAILAKLRHFYRACSSTILSFVTISILLFTAGVCRFLALFYNDFFGKYMDNNVFAVLCYVVPDFLPCSVITAMQINIMIKHKQEYRPISGLEEESVRLI